jgi:hypothetical protein
MDPQEAGIREAIAEIIEAFVSLAFACRHDMPPEMIELLNLAHRNSLDGAVGFTYNDGMFKHFGTYILNGGVEVRASLGYGNALVHLEVWRGGVCLDCSRPNVPRDTRINEFDWDMRVF